MTSATEKLRQLLDERGVEWEAPNNACADLQTFFKVGRWYVTADSLWYDKERLGISMNDTLTPEQAIAVTLGRRTCHLEETVHQREIASEFGGGYYEETTHDCDECGFENADYNIRFCGGCGAKVVKADD